MPDTEPGPGQRALKAALRWLVTGNLVAKLGLVILFIGISFLLKYVAVRIDIPVELRIAAITAADIALLAWGWRIRTTRRGIGLPVQGTALAILMLVVFGMYRMVGLIPGGAALALLVVLTMFTCLLAVLQNAVWLALFGISGGFLAPVLTSSGTGSHIALFSYYAVLNAGILAIALKRSWRALNVAGLAFTAVIGIAWAVQRYTPENYFSVQCFLLLFFVFFTAISIIFALRQAGGANRYVDGVLVYGTPLLGAALQWALVGDRPFGAAFSALGGGVFYAALALALWRRRGDKLRLLVESFLAMGVVLGTLAVPLALDGRWTSAAWAVEGAALTWLGLRHGRAGTWRFGLLVQLGAWFAFLLAAGTVASGTAAEARLWLGFLVLAGSSGLASRLFSRAEGVAPGTTFDTLGVMLLCVATAWLLAGTWTEIVLRTDGVVRGNLLAGTALLLGAALSVMAARAGWRGARGLGLMVQLLAGATLLVEIAGTWQWSWQAVRDGRPVIGVVLVTAAAFFTAWQMGHTRETAARRGAPAMFAWAALWWFGPLLDTGAAHVAGWTGMAPHGRLLPFLDLWPAYALCLAVSSVLLAWAAPRLRWRSLRWLSAPCWAGLGVATIEMLLELHAGHLPFVKDWIALAALLAAGEYLLHRWPRNGWHIGREALLAVHTVRCAGPWMMIWPLGFLLIGQWLTGDPGQRDLLAQAGWETTGSWARFVPLWVQMAVACWLLYRVRAGGWPVKPVPEWYGKALLPLAAAWTVFHVLVWNLTQDGAMAPLPYLPLANPLDLSTGFAAVLVVMLCRGEPGITLPRSWAPRLPWIAAAAAFAWVNLIVLRSASHWLDLPYRADDLFASRAVQAAFSLVWSATALILMRRAVGRLQRGPWLAGAAMLGLVVAKLFLVDLAASGSMARIVSFVGVGLLMLAIGYLAPYPAPPRQEPPVRGGSTSASKSGGTA
ncbi:DUF2339 domain-containing protein [Massilia dura]|uniref:DUF2339 domain-containing protein n=1 Tax=Pseudoduganella dura TaxID=321982 RepID=A0A6I3XH61_9BURK|nr:DUF2339 domain-containing protein [Pseudoduganella dura]MUI12018.1 DUF2339 domain-containing protein [Pseudoduganella dura]GGX82683.1 hypothetical protein GCM10007386_12100 [Pseudoduganella dura]